MKFTDTAPFPVFDKDNPYFLVVPTIPPPEGVFVRGIQFTPFHTTVFLPPLLLVPNSVSSHIRAYSSKTVTKPNTKELTYTKKNYRWLNLEGKDLTGVSVHTHGLPKERNAILDCTKFISMGALASLGNWRRM